jgi:hypothetical protein
LAECGCFKSPAYAHAQRIWAELGALGQSGLLPEQGAEMVSETKPLLQGTVQRRMLWKVPGQQYLLQAPCGWGRQPDHAGF